MTREIDAYRLLFPAGWLVGLAGVALWLFFLHGVIAVYPKEWHADLMMGGFLPLFAAGFLMTAMPRFCGTFGPRPAEIAAVLLTSTALSVAAFLPNRFPFHVSLGLFCLALLFFSGRRIRSRSTYPPPPLIFALVAFAAQVAASGLQAAHSLSGRWEILDTIGRLYLYEGFQLLLVLGVGIFLIPNLLGHPACTPPVTIGVRSPDARPLPFLSLVPAPLWIVSALFLVSFVLEVRFSPSAGRAVRAAIVTLVAFRDWKLHRLPAVRSALSLSLWISCWLLVVGLWLPVAVPSYAVHARHLAYVGGLGLMTLAVATRVTLAHGGHDLALERTSRLFKVSVGLVLLAASTRGVARLLPETAYWSHLLFAAWSWTAALLVWGWFTLPRMVRTFPQEGAIN